MGFNFVETDKIRKNKSHEVARTYLIIINTLEVEKKKKKKKKKKINMCEDSLLDGLLC